MTIAERYIAKFREELGDKRDHFSYSMALGQADGVTFGIGGTRTKICNSIDYSYSFNVYPDGSVIIRAGREDTRWIGAYNMNNL